MSCSCHQPAGRPEPCSREELAGPWMRLVFAALVAGQSMIFGLAVAISPPAGMARAVIHGALAASAVIVFLLVGGPVVRAAWSAARSGRIAIEQLFLAGIVGAFGASLQCTFTGTGHVYYEVVAILLAIYTFGRILGEQRREAAIRAARELGAEFERCQLLDASGSIREAAVADIQPGDAVRVTAGDGIPVDGTVLRGCAFVRESTLTGESFPVVRRPGDRVLAGSVALDQTLDIRTTAAGGQRVLDRLLETVRRAQTSGSRLERQADRLVGWFLPLVLGIAVLTFAGWTWAAGWERGLFNALAVLVVACPCSMGLATPIGIWAALSSLAKRKLIAKNGDFIEALGDTTTVVFDKTGTLGEEHLELVDFVVAPGIGRTRLLEEVAAVEANSRHPVAMGFRRDGVAPASGVATLPGTGIRGIVGGGIRIEVGNDGLLASPREGRQLEHLLLPDGGSSHRVWVRRNGQLAGLGLLRERLRAGSKAAIAALEAAGIRCVVMTGDRAEAARAHGFAELRAGMQADEKAAAVVELQRGGCKVLFVGDGVNDAPAMAVADAAIAVRGGSALTRETAGAELAGEDLAAIPAAIFRCRRALRAIHNNLLFAAVYNFAGIGLAAAGLIHPVVAALLMLASSLTVTWQALRETREEEDAAAPAPVRKRTPAGVPAGCRLLPRAPRWALAAGIALQGPVVVYLGGFTGTAAGAFPLVFLAAAIGMLVLTASRPVTPDAGMAVSMFSFGGLLMLAGWWADAGFGAVVRDGVCLCGCPDSGLGWGLFLSPNWMAGGMLLASVPAMFFETGTVGGARVWCWMAGVAGMFLGMEVFTMLMALVPVTAGAAGFLFFATYAAMVLGMSLGMLLACRLFRRFEQRRSALR